MNNTIKQFIKTVFLSYARVACKISPYKLGPWLAKREYKVITGNSLNLNNPQNIIEKIIWMQFHSDTSLWTKCADKYLVREFVKERGLEHILPKLYGCWESIEDINWSSLPNKFVLKTNNSCGQIIIVRDKSNLNIENTTKKLNRWLKMKYGYHNGQLHYLRIQPKIIAEELLEDSSLPEDANLFDYKIICINGEPETLFVVSDRSGAGYYITYFDLQWNNISDFALNRNSSHYGNSSHPKPKNFSTMLEYAHILSKGIPQVRIDFYNIDGKIYFGEMTFTMGYGSRSEEFSKYLGDKIDLTKIKRIR